MKKFYALLLSLGLVFALGAAAWAEYYNEGHTGNSWEDAYIIDSVDDFKLMRDRTALDRAGDGIGVERGKYYKLAADLDLTAETNWVSFGFEGYFDGQNHTITVNIIRENTQSASLFASLSEGTIKNLKVSGTIKGNDVAGIVLWINGGVLENCHFSGNIEGTGPAGGLSCFRGVSTYNDEIIQDDVTLKDCSFSGTVIGSDEVAGIIASFSSSGTIDSCRVMPGSTISCSGGSYAGGIIGRMYGSSGYVTNCTVSATISDAEYIGGIIAYALDASQSNVSGNTWPAAYAQIGNRTDSNSGSGSDDIEAGQEIDTKFLDSNGQLTAETVGVFFDEATAVSTVSDYELQNQLGLTADQIGNATDGYKVIGLQLPSGVTLSEGTKFFVLISDSTAGLDMGNEKRALGIGVISAAQARLNFLPIVFNLLKNPVSTNQYMTFEAGDYFIGTTDDNGTSSSAEAAVVIKTADATFAIKTRSLIPLQGQTASGTAVPIAGNDDADSDGSYNSGEGLDITASGIPASISDGEDLTFTLRGVTVTDGKITGVRKTDGTYLNIGSYEFRIAMEDHDSNNNNLQGYWTGYNYDITSDGKVTISASDLASNLAGFSGNKTIHYSVYVGDPLYSDDAEIEEYWGTLGVISVNVSDSGGTRFEQVVSSQDLSGAVSDDTVALPTVKLERVTITDAMRATILEMFASRDIIASEILSPFDDAGAAIYDDPAVFRNSDVDVIYPNSPLAALPILSVSTRGAYVFGVSLEDVVNPGTQLTSWAKVARNDSVSSAAKRSSSTINYAHALRSNGVKGSSIHSAAESSNSNALETMSTIYLNRDGKLISEVPEDQFVIIATCCNANTSKGLFIVENNELPWGIIDILKPDEVSADHIEQIAMELSVDVGSVRFLASSDIMRVAPAEPTKAMRSFAAENKYQFAAKLDTIRVKEKGVYIFKVVVPEELKGIKTDRFELLGIDPAALEVVSSDSSGDVNISVLPPVFAGIGSALDWAAIFGDDYWVVGAVLPAAQPLSMYILRLLLILLGGCDMGAGLGIFGLIAVCGGLAVFKIFRRK